ncbi:MAG: DUF4185 domain-containing protein [Fimbriimonas sp.]
MPGLLTAAVALFAMHQVVPGSVQKVAQLTGETDRQLGIPTRNQTVSRYGLLGTDLGASFEHEGKLVFLFGDTWPSAGNTPDRTIDSDSVAFCEDTNPDDGLTLDFVKAADGKYGTVIVPGIPMAAFAVPNGGFSYGGYMYAFFTTDIEGSPMGITMGRCVLIRSKDAKKWELVGTISTDKFINVSPQIVDAASVPGLPEKSGKVLLMWGASREYRRSNPYLACMPLDEHLGNRGRMRYWAGEGQWHRDESEARPLFHHPMIGEISVAWCEPIKRWLMTYNVEQPRCILMRTAEHPWGPWSQSTILFDTYREGLGKFMHQTGVSGPKGSLADPNREGHFGDGYGPYLIPRFFRKEDGGARIYFVMSAWNPYNVMLMRATIKPM